MQELEMYNLEKVIWTEDEFSQMGWHDNLIYGFASDVIDENEPWKNELYFDIDYIFRWIQPKSPNSHFTFWISPCTLVFKNVFDLKIDIDMSHYFQIQISDLKRAEHENDSSHQNYFSWEIELVDVGEISFNSIGFNQIVRKKPIYSEGLWLGVEKRGGISFDKTPC